METGKFVVLRNLTPAPAEFGPGALANARIARSGAALAAGIDFSVEAVQLNKREVRELRRDPSVLSYARSMPVRLIEPRRLGLGAAADEQTVTWGVKAVGADRSPYSGRGVRVAVLDTGIDARHDAFKGLSIVEKDFTGEGGGDKHGHGTHCAGTIFGKPVDGLRIGVAPGISQALIGKVLDARGSGTTEGISQAIRWALDSGAHVISMSLGMDFPGLVDQLVKDGLDLQVATSLALEGYRANVGLFNALAALVASQGALAQACVVVAAAGNESDHEANPPIEIASAPPAAAEGILSIGALGETRSGLSVASFSNSKVDISAPGVRVTSARLGGGLTALSGTSMATPHVAGVAALWYEKLQATLGTVSLVALSSRLVASGTTRSLTPGFDGLDVGTGLVQAPLD